MFYQLRWDDGFPTSDPGHNCVAMVAYNKLANVPCDNADDFYTDGMDDTKPGLAYICEARTIYGKDEDKSCHFPFEYDGVKYTSCSRVPIPSFNPFGYPWCPTHVDDNGQALEDKMILCQDEGHIIYSWHGRGTHCPIPFIYDRVFHDKCTRKDPNDPYELSQYYWCPPVPDSVENGNVYIPGERQGFCQDYLHPPGKIQ